MSGVFRSNECSSVLQGRLRRDGAIVEFYTDSVKIGPECGMLKNLHC
jgi:hypothetical protein